MPLAPPPVFSALSVSSSVNSSEMPVAAVTFRLAARSTSPSTPSASAALACVTAPCAAYSVTSCSTPACERATTSLRSVMSLTASSFRSPCTRSVARLDSKSSTVMLPP